LEFFKKIIKKKNKKNIWNFLKKFVKSFLIKKIFSFNKKMYASIPSLTLLFLACIFLLVVYVYINPDVKFYTKVDEIVTTASDVMKSNLYDPYYKSTGRYSYNEKVEGPVGNFDGYSSGESDKWSFDYVETEKPTRDEAISSLERRLRKRGLTEQQIAEYVDDLITSKSKFKK
jgi:hypothetical protein